MPLRDTRHGGARVPDDVRIYAVGDVHGRVDLLDQVLARVAADIAVHPVPSPIHVFIGDYIDRGPASREVLDRLIAYGRSHETIFLKGNHEVYLTKFLEYPAILEEWRNYGALETLMSYGLTPSHSAPPGEWARLATQLDVALPEDHRVFLNSLPTSYNCGDFFFVHAGIRPGTPLSQQREEDLLWIRDEFLVSDDDFGKVVVHGHTPAAKPEVRANRINIDTGAYVTGRLTCLVIERDELFFL
jgi:serine/threonine protein phosphatase 1